MQFFTSRKKELFIYYNTYYIIILIKKDKYNHYCNIFLEKASYELPKKYVFV